MIPQSNNANAKPFVLDVHSVKVGETLGEKHSIHLATVAFDADRLFALDSGDNLIETSISTRITVHLRSCKLFLIVSEIRCKVRQLRMREK